MNVYDLVVVGGGPAGSTAARRAAQTGARVLLIDAATFPRVKPCGGALSEQAMSCLDFTVGPEVVECEVFGARVHFGRTFVEARSHSRIAVLTQRVKLDHYLLGKAAEAGVSIVQGERVADVEVGDDCLHVHGKARTYSARFVVAADGAQSALARAVRSRLPSDEYAVTYEFDLPLRSPSPSAIADGLVEIYFGDAYMGYSWVFAKRDHWNVGVGALASQAPNVKTAAIEFSGEIRLLNDSGGIPERPVGWIVPVGGYRRPVGLGRILLAGDAAGFVDAFCGEGIAYAIHSGAAAGRMVGEACATRADPRHVQRRYATFCRDEIVNDLRYGLLFARLVHSWPDVLLRLFSTDRRFVEKYLDVLAARISYAQYVRWFVPRAVLALPRAVLSR